MDANHHPQRLGRIPEDLEIRLVELTFDDLRRNLDSAKSELGRALQFSRGGRWILPDGCLS